MSDTSVIKTVLVTGASRGIGREIARAFARQTNHALLVVARSKDDLAETVDLCKEAGASAVSAITCDLTAPEEVQRISVPAEFADPSIVINNAGSYMLKPLAETSYNEYLNQIEANLFSAVHVVDRFLPAMKESGHGYIINICSVGALEGLDDSGAYASSKHALLGYTRSLREELLQTGIGVSAINLGQTQSTSWEGSDIDPELLIDPADVGALLVAFSQLSPRSVVEEIIIKPQHGRVPPM